MCIGFRFPLSFRFVPSHHILLLTCSIAVLPMSHACKSVWAIRRRNMTASKTQNDENKNISLIRSLAPLTHSLTHTQKRRPLKISDSFRVNAAVKRSECKLPFLVHHGRQCVRWMCLALCAAAAAARLLQYIHFSIHRTVLEWWCYFCPALRSILRSRRITTTITKRNDAIIQCETVLCDAHWADGHTPFHIYTSI